jgi:hypothetical protein
MSIMSAAVVVLRASLMPRGGIIAENLALRHLIAAERTLLIGRLRADLDNPPVRTP